MSAVIPEPVLRRFSEFVATGTGLHFPPARWPDLVRGAEKAAKELGFRDAQSCMRGLLESAPDRRSIETLASHLSVGETYFFRDPAVFAALETEVLPPLIAARRAVDRHLRIWSAGCSTGEEAYSIAILLTRLLPDLADWNIRILGTDINPRFLSQASHGVYREWSFRGVPDWLRRTYFEAAEAGTYRVKTLRKDLVSFAYLNLVEDVYPSVLNNTNAMDIVLCRNVLMYFEPATIAAVARRLHHALVDGGWLIVNPAEIDASLFPGFTTVRIGDAILYRKDGNHLRGQARRRDDSHPAPARRPAVLSGAETQAPAAAPPVRADAAGSPRERRAEPYRSARSRYERGDYAGARNVLLASGDTGPQALALLGHACANLGDLDEACRWCEAAAAADKFNPGLRYLLASVLEESGRPEDAAAALRQALYLDPDHVLAHFALGNLDRRRGRPARAAKHFATVRRLLQAYGADAQLPDSEGLTAGRLREIIDATERIA